MDETITQDQIISTVRGARELLERLWNEEDDGTMTDISGEAQAEIDALKAHLAGW